MQEATSDQAPTPIRDAAKIGDQTATRQAAGEPGKPNLREVPQGSSDSKSDSPNPTRTLLQVIAVTAVVLGGIWYFSGAGGDVGSLEEAKAKIVTLSDELKTVREAKATADRTLAETQAKLGVEQKLRAAAEKAVADAKAILAGIPAAATPGAPEKPAEPAKGPATKQ